MAEAYIVDAVRTAGGRARKGGLIDIHPADLGATILNALVDRTAVSYTHLTLPTKRIV